MATLNRLAAGLDDKPRILVTQIAAILQRVPPKSAITTGQLLGPRRQ